jgi:hypothetical protein
LIRAPDWVASAYFTSWLDYAAANIERFTIHFVSGVTLKPHLPAAIHHIASQCLDAQLAFLAQCTMIALI